MRILLVCFYLFVLFARAAPVAAQSAPRARETRLLFDWPDGAQADVVATRTLENRARGSTIRSEARFALSISRAQDTTTLTARDLSVDPIRERLAEDAANAAVVAMMYLPPMTLTRAGRVAELSDPDAAQHEIEDALERAVPLAARSEPSWSTVSAAWSSAPALERAATSIVELMLSSLASRSLVTGTSIEGTGASPLAISGVVVPLRSTLLLDRALPCFDGDAAAGCVQVTLRSDADRAALTRIAQSAGLQGLEITMDATLVTEPRTLLPHRCEVRTRRLYSVAVGGSVRDIEELEIRTWAFTYRRDTIRRASGR